MKIKRHFLVDDERIYFTVDTEHLTLCTLGAHRSFLVINSVSQLNSLCCDYKESRQQVRVAFTIFMQCDQSLQCPEPSAQ